MHVAAILKVKGRNVVTTSADKSLLDVAKLLEQHDIGCLVIEGNEGQVADRVGTRPRAGDRQIRSRGLRKSSVLDYIPRRWLRPARPTPSTG